MSSFRHICSYCRDGLVNTITMLCDDSRSVCCACMCSTEIVDNFLSSLEAAANSMHGGGLSRKEGVQ